VEYCSQCSDFMGENRTSKTLIEFKMDFTTNVCDIVAATNSVTVFFRSQKNMILEAFLGTDKILHTDFEERIIRHKCDYHHMKRTSCQN